ncbi:hypothetical protein DRF68_07490 [Candidatus Chryseobacterium massiliae]|uniref:Uncharacterized protein n=1 Tax=Candidatus Chryseobacterium massiliense TaxID=204089 RepID=A0A3D9BCJ9_9FLAO|nr:hypothetical protein DRF68_07490 [Candidatus Chryseobacterium massiliae]
MILRNKILKFKKNLSAKDSSFHNASQNFILNDSSETKIISWFKLILKSCKEKKSLIFLTYVLFFFI